MENLAGSRLRAAPWEKEAMESTGGCRENPLRQPVLPQVEDVVVSNVLHVFSKQYCKCLLVPGLCGFLHFRQLILWREGAACGLLLEIMKTRGQKWCWLCQQPTGSRGRGGRVERLSEMLK